MRGKSKTGLCACTRPDNRRFEIDILRMRILKTLAFRTCIQIRKLTNLGGLLQEDTANSTRIDR
jgi:hypothetical protein